MYVQYIFTRIFTLDRMSCGGSCTPANISSVDKAVFVGLLTFVNLCSDTPALTMTKAITSDFQNW